MGMNELNCGSFSGKSFSIASRSKEVAEFLKKKRLEELGEFKSKSIEVTDVGDFLCVFDAGDGQFLTRGKLDILLQQLVVSNKNIFDVSTQQYEKMGGIDFTNCSLSR